MKENPDRKTKNKKNKKMKITFGAFFLLPWKNDFHSKDLGVVYHAKCKAER